MKKRNKVPLVFFNASVILAGLASPEGGSAKILKWVKQEKIAGLISEIVLDETILHSEKISLSKEIAQKKILEIFNQITLPPKKSSVESFKETVIDYGDAHLLASCQEEKVEFLVTLDKKHLLSISEKIKIFKIVSPKQLIENINIPLSK